MQIRDNFILQQPLWIGIWGLLAIVYIIFRSQRKGLPFLYEELLPKTSSRIIVVRETCIVLLLLTIGTILSKPSLTNTETEIQKEGIDIMLALDISESMLANDFSPDRLTVAKQVLSSFVEKLETDRVGIVVFAGKPFTSVPLTFDYQIIKDVLAEISTKTINQQVRGLGGTAIGDALLTSINILEKSNVISTEVSDANEVEKSNQENREKIIILLTDGEANQGVDPLVAGGLASDSNIKTYTVGIGSLQGGWIQQGPYRQQVGGVDEGTLQEIASLTDGRYRRATDEQAFQAIFDEISTLEKSTIQTDETTTYTPLYTPFAIILLLLISGLFVQELWFTIQE